MEALAHDRVALVTGASRGIGRAVALRLAEDGHRVAVNYVRNEEAAQSVVQAITETGGLAIAIQADVGKTDEARQLVEQIHEHLGAITVLVNNAGIARSALVVRMSDKDWDDIIETNLRSVYACSKAVVRDMIRARWGRIVNITSVRGLKGNGGEANYGAAKAGMIGFTRCLAHEVASRGITVNAVAPGYIPTDMTAVASQEFREQTVQQIPMGRPGTSEEVAAAVAFLVSTEASYITGHVLTVDGGWSA